MCQHTYKVTGKTRRKHSESLIVANIWGWDLKVIFSFSIFYFCVSQFFHSEHIYFLILENINN